MAAKKTFEENMARLEALVAQLERFATLGIPILLVGILGTTLVIGLSGRAAQEVGKREAKKRGEGQKHE